MSKSTIETNEHFDTEMTVEHKDAVLLNPPTASG